MLSWGRDDADAELWALIVEAINTPAAERTTDQQNAAAWMMQLASAQANDAAKQTGAEYTTWAGLDVTDYERMADTATKDQLTAFLSEDVRPFSPLFTPSGGYCRYRPPAPFSADYDGSATQTCFVPCSFLTCAIPTPTYDDFVKWGQAAVSNDTLSDASLLAQRAQIAEASMYAMVGVAAAVVLGTALTAILSTATVSAVTLRRHDPRGRDRDGRRGRRDRDHRRRARHRRRGPDHPPGDRHRGARGHPRLRERIPARQDRRVRRQRPDGGHRPGDADRHHRGCDLVFTMFVGATLPRPRYDIPCDNSLIPPWAYTSASTRTC